MAGSAARPAGTSALDDKAQVAVVAAVGGVVPHRISRSAWWYFATTSARGQPLPKLSASEASASAATALCIVPGRTPGRSVAGPMVGRSRRRDCYFADKPSPSILKHLLKGEWPPHSGVQQTDSLADS